MKKTFPIKKGQYWELVKALKDKFGYPRYYHELVIYFRSPDDFRVTLTRDELRWSWADKSRDGKLRLPKHRVKTGPRDVKEKLIFFSGKYGNRGDISVCSVLGFYDKETKIGIELRSGSFLGEIVSMIYPDDIPDKTTVEKFFIERIRDHVKRDLFAEIKKIKRANEEVIQVEISDSPILHTKIMDFCRDTGIMNPFKKMVTYREILSQKSNNYGMYESLFQTLTGIELLTKAEHAPLPSAPENDVSIIIPCYNSGSTINRVLKSIQHQKLPSSYFNSIEVVIIDDHSEEEISRRIDLGEYPFKIEIVRLSENRGVSHAREIGVTHSTGEILIFVDSDVVLSQYYVSDHIVRNMIIDNAVFVSFKENVDWSDSRIALSSIQSGVSLPKYSNDLRIHKEVPKGAIGSYSVGEPTEVNIFESTNYFKDFYGSRVFGVYDLSCMVTGHNFSVKRKLLKETSPFNRMFSGWGMEDVYFGLKMISNGNFIVPILSCGVFHINHPVRSGSEEKKRQEYRANALRIDSLLDSFVE